MEKIRIHRFIIIMVSIPALGLLVASIMGDWEFWVNPILVAGIICMWVLHIGQYLTERRRETFYLAFGMFATLFHGVHATSFFDVVSIISLMMVIFSLYDSQMVLNLILAEYFFIMGIQYIFLVDLREILSDSLSISRISLQLVVVVSIYFVCRITVSYRLWQEGLIKDREEDIAAYDRDMEDFLSNISHELRTPVNVVNGMSMLLLRQGGSSELDAIRDAGLRLSNQIEDIQDYTEVKRSSLVLENESYMITSLVHDMVMDYRRYTEDDELELVIDLNPKVPNVLKGDVRKLKKILRHLLHNAIKFTRRGGIYVRIFTEQTEYGTNLCLEVTDTGIGMKRKDISKASGGLYQANKKRNRSTGGIGLGLPIVYGLTHKMGGFIKIESTYGQGTTVRVTIPQSVVDASSCLKTESASSGDVLFHVRSEKYRVPAIREFYRQMATNLAIGLRRPLYSAESVKEVDRLMERLNVSHIFMGEEEYVESSDFFDELSRSDIVVAVSARPGFTVNSDSKVIVMPKPLYGFPVVKVLNGERLQENGSDYSAQRGKLKFDSVRALIVDDEPMNLVVASGMFRDEYGMHVENAGSGRESIEMFENNDYDIIFMDHMMPEMDGVEAMKHIKEVAKRDARNIKVIALTANAMSGAREMFLNEGFDGFIAKPIDISEFERVMKRVLPRAVTYVTGGDR